MTRSKVYPLDANLLIALATPEHSLNERAAAWYRKGRRFATCPITQGALIRFHLRAGMDATAESAKLLLESVSTLSRHEFWPDDASYLDMPTTGIIGHRQVTGAYLALLARKHNASLATMDEALAAVHAGTILVEDCQPLQAGRQPDATHSAGPENAPKKDVSRRPKR